MVNNPNTETVDEVKVALENRIHALVESAYQEYQAKLQQEAAAPQNWWDLLLIGPFQPGAHDAGFIGDGPLLPHRIIQASDTFYYATVLLLNPSFPGPGFSACNLLSNMEADYRIDYYSGSLQSWAPAPYNTTVNSHFNPDQCLYIDVVQFEAERPNLIEMNVTARILNCRQVPLPHFGGFATAVYQFNSGIFGPPAGFDFNVGSRFMITD
ncbi:MAG: hypothetical protein K8L99_16710 [Anaerolineae bacterium]|nr:hypothetical protein [Anaerolineae bacterium]